MSGLDSLVARGAAYSGSSVGWGKDHPGFAFDEDVAGSVIESRDRDSAWIARELGDVPHETITGLRSAAGTRTPWHGDCIPVESLGRDA